MVRGQAITTAHHVKESSSSLARAIAASTMRVAVAVASVAAAQRAWARATFTPAAGVAGAYASRPHRPTRAPSCASGGPAPRSVWLQAMVIGISVIGS